MSIIFRETHDAVVRKIRKRARVIQAILVGLFAMSVLYQMAGQLGNSLIRESYQVVRQHLMDRQSRYMLLEILRNKPLSVGQALEVADVVIDESQASKVPIHVVLGVMSLESEFKPSAVSSENARGLMQVLPATWKKYVPSSQLQNYASMHSPALNVRVGIRYLGDLWKEYGSWPAALKEYGGFTKADPRPYIRIVMANAKKYEKQLEE
jgi:soluble lytic murein transglycosylase-like protein